MLADFSRSSSTVTCMTADTNTPDDTAADKHRVERAAAETHEEVLLEKPMLTARIVVVCQTQT